MLLQATGARVPDPPEEPPHPSPPRTPPNPPSKPGNQGDIKGTHGDLGDIKLLDAWLAVELEILALKEREGGANGAALRDAKKRSRMLWKQVLRMWKFDKILKRKRKSKAKSKLAQGAPAEQVEQVAPDEQVELDGPEFSSLDEMSDAEFYMTEEPPCKKPCLQVTSELSTAPFTSELSEHEMSEYELSDSELPEPATASASRSRLPTRTRPLFTTHQKDQMRALICAHLGNRYPPVKKVEKTAQDTGLTVYQVRHWVNDFYRAHPSPTLEQALAWRTRCQGGEVSAALYEWLAAHQDHPYPSDEELAQLASETGRTTAQLRNWIGGARSRKGLSKKRPSRTRHPPFSKNHTAILTEAFNLVQYPSQEEVQRLALEIGADVSRVKRWVRNRRSRQGVTKKTPRLSAEQVAPLRAWLHGHMDDPFPSREKRKELAQETGLDGTQVADWFCGVRTEIKRNTA